MGVAVCGTHYSGMGAATYTLSEENYASTTKYIINGAEATIAASHGALLICYWFASFSVVRVARKNEMATATTTHEPEARSSAGDGGSNHTTHAISHTPVHKPAVIAHAVKKTPLEQLQDQPTGSGLFRKVYIAPDDSETPQSEQS